MKILAIDTSGKTAGAAVSDGDEIRGEFNITSGALRTRHSAILLPMIDALFEHAGALLQDMDYIACVNGPGSFTGLRIGAAAAQGLARAANKPLIPVPTLDALAYNMGNAAENGDYILPTLDARRSQVYTALYRFDGKRPVRQTEYLAVGIEKIPEILSAAETGSRVIRVTDGSTGHTRRAASAALRANDIINAANDIQLYKPQNFPLLYIRKPQAERALLGEQ